MKLAHLPVLIKPVSGCCDLRCAYCFYRDETHLRGQMSDAVMQAVIDHVLTSAQQSVSFAFQGGEPTLAGLDFFRRFVNHVKRMNAKRLPVFYSIQTNGCSIDETWAEFLAQHHFLVGLSMDGTRTIHDRYRQTATGEPTFQTVQHAAECLRAANVEFNILTVVTGELCRHAKSVYAAFKKQGYPCIQPILCLAPEECPDAAFAPTPAEYARFLIDLFDVWYADWQSGRYCSIRYFDNLIRRCMGQPAELCSVRGSCTAQLVVESDGSCYPCDFYVTEACRLGNLAESTPEFLLNSDAARRFQTPPPLHPDCRACPYLPLCGGGCRRERFGAAKTAYCESYRLFFQRCLPRILVAAKTVQNRTHPKKS